MEVLDRLRKSLIPWPPNFIDIARKNPDLCVFLELIWRAFLCLARKSMCFFVRVVCTA